MPNGTTSGNLHVCQSPYIIVIKLSRNKIWCVSSFLFATLVFKRKFTKMGKSEEESMTNPFIPKDSELHALTRAEEENCYKDMKAKALEACQLPIKGIYLYY